MDIAGLPDGVLPKIDDYWFRVGNDNDPSTWPDAPGTPIVMMRESPDNYYAKRVTLIWPDYAIRNQWLEVTVLADNLGLFSDDVFYFGNAVGESGNSDTDARVTAADLLLARNNPRDLLNAAPIDFPYDYNRDGQVNAVDVLLATITAGVQKTLEAARGQLLKAAGGAIASGP